MKVIQSASLASKPEASMSSAVSPLAPTDVPEMPAIAGVKLATAAAGIRYKGRTDVLLAVMDKGTTAPASSPCRSARRRRWNGAGPSSAAGRPGRWW